MALTPLDFPASPAVGTLYPDPPVTGQPTYRWDGAQWLSYAAASLPTPTKPNNYGKKNYIINGAMMVSQENGATAGTVTPYYPVDQFSSVSANTGTRSISQVNNLTPGGSPNRIRCTVTVADAAVAASDQLDIRQLIEGIRIADLKFGTAAARTITVQFGVKAPAGTYCLTIMNGPANRSYVSEYTITAGEANTDVVKSVTIPGCTDGTWADNIIGFYLFWTLMMGTGGQQAANSWVAGSGIATSNQFNFMGTAGNIFELFDVSLTEGSVAPPFQVPDYASELALCYRYFYSALPPLRGLAISTIAAARMACNHPATMRGSPSVTIKVPLTLITGLGTTGTISSVSVNYSNTLTLEIDGVTAGAVTGVAAVYQGTGYLVANARL